MLALLLTLVETGADWRELMEPLNVGLTCIVGEIYSALSLSGDCFFRLCWLTRKLVVNTCFK